MPGDLSGADIGDSRRAPTKKSCHRGEPGLHLAGSHSLEQEKLSEVGRIWVVEPKSGRLVCVIVVPTSKGYGSAAYTTNGGWDEGSHSVWRKGNSEFPVH